MKKMEDCVALIIGAFMLIGLVAYDATQIGNIKNGWIAAGLGMLTLVIALVAIFMAFWAGRLSKES